MLAAGAFIGGGLYAFQRIELFLLRDARFVIATPDYGLETPSIRIAGVHYASRAQVLRVFAPDFGRSLYQVPMKERRNRLLQLDWVRDAYISRIWPNRLIVHVKEREPVAFIQVPAPGGLSRFALIDSDGVILQPPKQAGFKLPLALGVRPGDSLQQRRDSVHRMSRLIEDLGPTANKISEVDVSDPDNLKVSTRVNDRAITLIPGGSQLRAADGKLRDSLPADSAEAAECDDPRHAARGRITAVEGKTE